MLPFTGSDRECISSLTMGTSPSWSFLWGKIASIVFPRLGASDPSSSTTTFGRYFLCPTLCLRHTPIYHSARTVLLPTLHLNLPVAKSLYIDTKALLKRFDHKKAGIKQIGSHNYQVHQAPQFQLRSCVGNTILALQFHQLPLKLSTASHQLHGFLQGWSPFSDKLFLLFYSCFVWISTNLVATMPSCNISSQTQGVTKTNMGVTYLSNSLHI